MHTYHLQDEFRDPAAERQLLAAIAQQPTLYFELLDSLPTDVFTDTQEVWQQLTRALETTQPLRIPPDWEPASDPHAIAQYLADLHQRREPPDDRAEHEHRERADDEGMEQALDHGARATVSVISTRRLRARPVGVALSSTGWLSARPSARMRFTSTVPASSALTESARSCERCQFDG